MGEELGFVGAVGVVVGFGIVAWRGLRAARRAPDAFAAFLAAGATAMIVVQAAINLSVVLALVPTKGIPLPFVSYGGSSLVASLDRRGPHPEHLAARGPGARMSLRFTIAG